MLDKDLSINIKNRRSIFPNQFNGQPINRETIVELLNNANTAPTHKLTQPWIFKVFSGKSKYKLANELMKLRNPTSILFNEKIQTKFHLSSHIICVCMRRDKSKSIPEWEEIAATAMAVQNIWLSCVNSKVGGYWSTPKEAEKLNTFLNLTTYERCLGLFYLGIYESIKPRDLPRKDIEKDIEWYE